MGRDSNSRYAFTYTRFPGVRLKPLGHPSREKRDAHTRPSTQHPGHHACCTFRGHPRRSVGTDRERFELSIPRKRYAGFRDRCLQPLGHLSNRAEKASQAKNDGQRTNHAISRRHRSLSHHVRTSVAYPSTGSRLAGELDVIRHRRPLTTLHHEPHVAALQLRDEPRLRAVEREHVRAENP
jgi:hypothetical protein